MTNWLANYEYRNNCTVVATAAGAQTNYQLELIVGESSGASGEDVDCENHCQDFPNDIRFTKEDGVTEHDYWVEVTEGITPNRKATIIIEVASIPASGTVDFYMYYGDAAMSSASSVANTFVREIDSGQPVIGAWTLNGNALDTSGNANNGSLNGGMGYTTGKFGQAALFDGTDDYINCGTNACLNITDAITIEAWVKQGNNPATAPIITKGCLLDAYALNIRNDLLTFKSYKTRYKVYTFASGTWYHVAGTFGDGYTRIYINGNLEYSTAETGSINTNAEALCIGWDLDAIAPTPHFDGVIDEGKIYDRALTGDEISDIYGTGGDRYGYTTLNYPGRVLVRKYASPEPTWGSWSAETCRASEFTKGFYFVKLDTTTLIGLEKDSFRITEELNKIPSFEFEIANCTENRAAITAGITDTLRIYRNVCGVDTLMFTGIINGDAIEYLSLERIRIIGYASYIDLNWRFHQHLDSSDAEAVSTVFDSGAGYTNYTTQANNDTINDVLLTFSAINHALYIGMNETFFGAQIKYSTKGVQAANTTVVVEYSQTGVSWATMDVLDESRAFTEDAGTCYLTIPHKPSDWAKQTVNSVKRFWIRVRISAGSYTTPPKLDRIKMMNVDAYRVYYFNTAANTIMDDVLAGTGYSMDVTDACPADVISIVGEYETKLRLIAGVANALTWDDGGDKKAYQWWIDTSKKVHFKQERGAVHGDITGDLTILNNSQDYFNLSNRLHFMGNYDGLNQIRAVIEDTGSQDTHEIRELAVPAEQYNNYTPLKEAAQKAMTYTKAPLQKIAATVTTKYWIDNSFEVGDTVTLHATSWDVASQAFQIVRADIGPRVTNLDIGVSQEHLDSLKAGLQRQLDINNIRMHGSTSLLQFGPETANYHRVDNTTVYPARLNIEIPSATRYIQKVFLSWTIGPYRSSVDGGGETSGHDHTGSAGAGGAFTPDVSADGKHTPVAVAQAHGGYVKLQKTLVETYLLTTNWSKFENIHTHTNPTTASQNQGHTHSGSSIDACTANYTAVSSIYFGSSCESGQCVTNAYTHSYADSGHTHSCGSTGGISQSHTHTQGATGAGSNHAHELSVWEIGGETTFHVMTGLTATFQKTPIDPDTPTHNHTVAEVPDHDHLGVAEGAHSDHVITTEAAADIALTFGIHEEAAGTLLELIINGETVSSSYSGNQLEIRIDGYLSTGNNTVLIQPATGENGKKGSCTTLGGGTIFIEAGKF